MNARTVCESEYRAEVLGGAIPTMLRCLYFGLGISGGALVVLLGGLFFMVR